MDEWIKNMCYVYTTDYYSTVKRMKLCHFGNMDGPWGLYVKWNKSDQEKYHIISLICGIQHKTKKQSTVKQPKQNRLMVSREKGWVDVMGERGQKVQTSNYKINKSWECNLQNSD